MAQEGGWLVKVARNVTAGAEVRADSNAFAAGDSRGITVMDRHEASRFLRPEGFAGAKSGI
jgi:hypothetical protein